MPRIARLLSVTAALLLLAGAAQSQELLDRRRGDRIFARLAENSEGQPLDRKGKRRATLRGWVHPLKVALNLSFRFQAGYYIEIPVQQFEGAGHQVSVLVRVTPEEAEPAYLSAIYPLPQVPQKTGRTVIAIGGMFFLGQGSYQVDIVVSDERRRMFQHSERIKAELHGSEKQIRPVALPGTVSTLSSLRFSRTGSGQGRPIRLTVLLHAAPSFWPSTVLRSQDVGRLVGALSGLVEQVNIGALRVVAFNLDQQKELYRSEDFRSRTFEELQQALLPIQLGTVDVSVLQNKQGHVDLLADLINRELDSEPVPGAVVVLGPTARTRSKVGAGLIEEARRGTRFFYFQYRSFRERNQAQLPDTIESAMKRVGGKVFHIFTPADFAKAIAEFSKDAPA